MIRISIFVVAATIGLAGYAFAQDTTTGAPAGDTPMKPEPMSKMMMHHPHHPMHMHRMHHMHGRSVEKKITEPAVVPK